MRRLTTDETGKTRTHHQLKALQALSAYVSREHVFLMTPYSDENTHPVYSVQVIEKQGKTLVRFTFFTKEKALINRVSFCIGCDDSFTTLEKEEIKKFTENCLSSSYQIENYKRGTR
jgi:hypothetical protein